MVFSVKDSFRRFQAASHPLVGTSAFSSLLTTLGFPFGTLLATWRCAPQAQFREAVTRMESLMEQEAKDSVAAIKNLRDKAMLAKDRQAPFRSASG